MDGSAATSKNATGQDPLLECLYVIIQLYKRHYSKDVLVAGLPLENHRLSPSLFVRAAERAGFRAKIVRRSLKKLTNLVLPALLVLKDNQCCVLHKWLSDDNAEIFSPELGIGTPVKKSFEELNQMYSGYAILVHPVSEFDKSNEDKPTLKKPRSWFWGTLWLHRKSYFEVIIAALFINIFSLVSPLFIMNVYDRVVPNNALITLWTLAVGILIIFIFDLILRFLRAYLIDVVGKKADILMASSIFNQVLTMEMRYKPHSVGSFVSSMREFENVRDFFTSTTLTTIVDLPFLVLYILLIGYLGSYIIIVPLVAVPFILIMAWVIQRPLYKTIRQATESAAHKHAIMVESLSGLEVLKSMNAEGVIQQKYEQAVGINARLGLRSRFLSGSVTHLSNFVQQSTLIAVVIVGVYEIQNNMITLGGIIACSILAGRMMAPLSQMISLMTRYQQAKYALKGLNNLMNLPTEFDADKKYLHRQEIKGEIEFQHVTFQYPAQEQTKALDDVSFKIKPGEHIAIIGRIGSGKTTLQKLILSLYHPQRGSVYIDGIDIEQMDPANLRRNIGYVPQEVLLFSGTIRDNIAMMQPWVEDKNIIEAARYSGADSFIDRHPLGYNLHVGERGERLSGGQRQTVALARALLTNPTILLFDEPTSSMDDELEQEWVKKMKDYAKGKTMLIVTHKVSLLSLTERILILDRGKIIVDGPKETVLARILQAKEQKLK